MTDLAFGPPVRPATQAVRRSRPRPAQSVDDLFRQAEDVAGIVLLLAAIAGVVVFVLLMR